MTLITFRDWMLTVDREATELTYAAVANGSAEECKCNDCANYVISRSNAFPEEIKSLLNLLGIDYRKESEVWRMYKHADGLHRYSGFFHFKGSFEGKDCSILLPNGDRTVSLTPVNDSFSIGFTMGKDLTYFKDTENLIQVEFETRIPWMIDKKLESDW